MSNIDDGIGTKNDSSASSDTGSFGLISLVKRGLQSLTSIITNLPNTANGVKVDGSAVTQPVSGTVTSNIGTIAGIATEATLSAINTNSTNGNKITQSRGTYNATPPTVTGGTEIVSFSVAPASNMFIDLEQYGFEFEAGDTITISAQSSNASECSVNLDLREQW